MLSSRIGNFGKVAVGSRSQKFWKLGVWSRSRKVWKVGVGYFTSDSATLLPRK